MAGQETEVIETNDKIDLQSKGLVTHNDILKIYKTIRYKKDFSNILKLFLKYIRNKRFSNQTSDLM